MAAAARSEEREAKSHRPGRNNVNTKSSIILYFQILPWRHPRGYIAYGRKFGYNHGVLEAEQKKHGLNLDLNREKKGFLIS